MNKTKEREEALERLNRELLSLDAKRLNTRDPAMKQEYSKRMKAVINDFNLRFPDNPVDLEVHKPTLSLYDSPKGIPEVGSAQLYKNKWPKLVLTIIIFAIGLASLKVWLDWSAKTGKLSIRTDIDCDVYVNKDKPFRLRTTQPKELSVEIGKHQIKAVSIDKRDSLQKDVAVNSSDQIVEEMIELQPIIKERLTREKEEERQQQELVQKAVQDSLDAMRKRRNLASDNKKDNPPTGTASKPIERYLDARPSYIKGRQEYDRDNYSVAASYWEQAAKQDYAMAQYCLVFLYLWKDRSGLRSPEKAEYWALKAVKHNDSEFDSDTCKTEIMFSLGFIYAKRNDCREAQKWYLHAADRGDSKAQLNLGLLELNGCGWPNPVKAETWFFLSARQGEKDALEALFQLGMMYYEGDTEGIPKDCRAAIRCWEKARDLGSWKARTTLERPDLRNCQ